MKFRTCKFDQTDEGSPNVLETDLSEKLDRPNA